MELHYDNIEIFRKNISSLKETSQDTDGKMPVYMTNLEVKVINFDKVKDCYIKGIGVSQRPCSSDAIYIGKDEKIYFIEFKNGSMKKDKVFNVYNKVYDSLLIFNDIVKENISFCREHVYFILVYNEKKNLNNSNEDSSKAAIAKYFYGKAGKNYVRFGMDRFKKIYFKDVLTYTESEFEKIFLNLSEME